MASHKRKAQKLQHRDQASLLAEWYSIELAKHHINVDPHLGPWWHWYAAHLTLLPHELCHIGRVVTYDRPRFVPRVVLLKFGNSTEFRLIYQWMNIPREKGMRLIHAFSM